MEDAHHARTQGREEAYVFVVDSRQRDVSVWPTPSEYEIHFNSPFTNVVGLDLLDATVARTEYIVGPDENTLVYALGQPPSLERWSAPAPGWMASDGRRRVVTLDPGDYNLPQFLDHLNARLAAAAAAAGEPALVALPRTNPAEVSNKVQLACSRPFTLDMGASTVRHALGFGDPVGPAPAGYATVPGWTVNYTGGASRVFCSVETRDVPGEDPGRAATTGPVPAAHLTQYEPLYGARTVRQYFRSAVTGPPTRAAVYATATAGAPALAVRVARASDDATLAAGVAQLEPSGPDDAYAPDEVGLAAVADALLVAGELCYVEFSAAGGGGAPGGPAAGVYYNDDNVPVPPDRRIVVDGVPAHEGMNVCVDVWVGAWAHAVTSPGVVDLSGPRFVNIRCPNIESYIFRDRVNEKCHAGLGMVALRGYGFRQQRYDFVSFPPRRFHMLGQVARLRFRLERPDGSLYDSNGVDHTLLLVMRYYVADRPTPAASVLAPSYDPDLRNYMVTQRWAEEARAKDPTEFFYGARADGARADGARAAGAGREREPAGGVRWSG